MREYYYLTGLEDSPYDLSMADALHLGATDALPTYVYLTEHAVAERITWDKQAATDTGSPYAEDPPAFYESRSVNFKFVRAPRPTLAGLEKAPTPVEMEYAQIDHHSDGRDPVSIPFRDSGNWPHEPLLVTFLSDPPQVSRNDLLFFADDLEELADKGRIKRRADETSTAASGQPDADRQDYPPDLEALPHKFQQLYAAIAGGELPDFEAAINAWYLHWHERPARGERDTYPKNPTIQAWLEDRGVSRNKAESIPPLIRPNWG